MARRLGRHLVTVPKITPKDDEYRCYKQTAVSSRLDRNNGDDSKNRPTDRSSINDDDGDDDVTTISPSKSPTVEDEVYHDPDIILKEISDSPNAWDKFVEEISQFKCHLQSVRGGEKTSAVTHRITAHAMAILKHFEEDLGAEHLIKN